MKFWSAAVTPSSGTSFTVSPHSWYGGQAAGQTLELGFQMSFAGAAHPQVTSLAFNGNSFC